MSRFFAIGPGGPENGLNVIGHNNKAIISGRPRSTRLANEDKTISLYGCSAGNGCQLWMVAVKKCRLPISMKELRTKIKMRGVFYWFVKLRTRAEGHLGNGANPIDLTGRLPGGVYRLVCTDGTVKAFTLLP